MAHVNPRAEGRLARHARIRKQVMGLPQRPRLCVFRSHKHLYAQLIDDVGGKTLLGCSTQDERLKKLAQKNRMELATALGKFMAAEAKQRGITRVVFDRGGYLYHGRVKAVAEAVRAEGLQV